MGRRVRHSRGRSGGKREFWSDAPTTTPTSFRKDSSLKPGAMEISCNHDDFTDVPEDEDFEIEVSYRRPIEGGSWRRIEEYSKLNSILSQPSVVSDTFSPSRAVSRRSSTPTLQTATRTRCLNPTMEAVG